MRVDTASLISGSIVCGDRGLGVLGSAILADTATGDHGAGYLYNDVDSGDEAKEFRGLIVTPPSAGTFFAYEDGSFSLVAPDNTYTFVYRLYVDGADLGTATASITIGGAATASLSLTTDSTTFAGAASVSPLASLSLTTDSAAFAGSATSGATFADFNITTADAVFSGSAAVAGALYWPLPAQVQLGITYGPTGADYTGTLTGGSGPSAADIAAAVRADLATELLRIAELAQLHALVPGTDLVVTPSSRSAGSVVQSIGTAGATVTVSRAP